MKKLFVALLIVLTIASAFADSADRPSVAVVLSGGGAKGIAHVAILEKLEELGIPIDRVYGTSMGALVGGIYAAGYTPKEIEAIMLGNDLSTLFNSLLSSGYNEVLEPFDFNRNNILSLSLEKGIGDTTGLIDDYMILNYLYEYLGNVPEDMDFDDLPVSYRCNATNMLNGEDTVFDSGSLIEAIRASISIPIVFEPVVTPDAVYMDGGLADNMPVHLAVEDGYDIVIAVAVNRTEDFTPEHYNSFSGTLDGTIEIAIKRGSLGEKDLATLFIRIDTSAFTTLGFGKADRILAKGKEDVAKYENQLKAIADLFTEDQKVYKDPDRTGDYFTRYAGNSGEQMSFTATKDYKQEELLSKTRFSLGVYGGGGYSFSLSSAEKIDEKIFSGLSQFKFYPTVSLRLYLKDRKVKFLSYDLRLKGSVNRDLSLDATVLAKLTGDLNERVFITAGVLGRAGSLTNTTDPTGMLSFNYTDFDVDGVLGVKVTDELSHSFNLRLRARNMWTLNMEDDEDSSMYNYCFIPSVQIDGLYYPGYSSGLFVEKGSRVDFVANAGYCKGSLTYILKAAAEHTFSLDNNNSIWIDGAVATHRGPEYMRDYYDDYGGWDGLPGYNYGSLVRDGMLAGVGYQRILKRGMISSYLAVELRAGLRSEYFYDFFPSTADSMVPFYECFNSGHWDLGLGVGYGLSTPIGDMLVGFGINKDLLISLYFEVK